MNDKPDPLPTVDVEAGAARPCVERALAQMVSPADVLRCGADEPRGFWAQGDAWIAHVGVIADLSSGPGSGESLERFGSIAEQAAALEASDGVSRLYGGFSFAETAEAKGSWAGFPAGRFIAPAMEVEVSGEGAMPLLRVFASEAVREDQLEKEIDRWVARLSMSRGTRPNVERGSQTGNTIGPRVTGLDPSDWAKAVEDALGQIETDMASKIVVARTLDVEPVEAVDPVDVAMALWEENRGSHVFLYEPEPGSVLLGAAPETVATLNAGSFRATAVAGSVGVGATSAETAALARRLFESRKDRAEQQFVVEHMVEALEASGCTVHVDVEPHVLTLAQIQHLETKIIAEVPVDTGVLDLLRSLHPTPAVCGVPRDAALAWLEDAEPFDRGWYAGPVGWFDAEGRGVFVPALRSAVLNDGVWRLFAGCGIVTGSDPEAEWQETAMKFRPVLRALIRAGMSPEVLERAA